ncbi:DUF3014 domain-containing protein [Pseudidiomarina atlantica]|jgi:hypothetical protein|uniref:DUF3014 domain-containing protein n=1 Tax=Pseudidiomarina atlantica TaxID=1517416 RepID=UPI00068EEF86|nr:DUF3014 domain-containing protein [Pseudidiomarina atlantica]
MSLLNTQQPSVPQQRGNVLIPLLLVILLAGVLIWFVTRDDSPEQPQPVQEIAAPATATDDEEDNGLVEEPAETVELGEPEIPETPTVAEPEVAEVEPEIELPSLNESSEEILSRIEAEEQSIEPLRSEQLIRDAVVFVDNLRNGVVVRDAALIEGPQTKFRALEQDGKIYIDPRSYDRYNSIVDWFVSFDTEVMLTLMNDYEPLVREALAEIGYPDTDPKTVILDAIEVLNATPSVGTVIELSDETVMYRYADPALEALPDAQKQMLRMGPDNIRRVKLKLEQLREALTAAS